MKHKLFRTLIALCLILVLLVNVSPLKAQAMSGGGVLSGAVLSLPAPVVIGSILIGLGITAYETGVFEELVDFVVDKVEAAGEAFNGMIDTWVVSDGETETYTVSEDLIKDTLEGALESGLISYSDGSAPVLTSGSVFRTGALSYYIPYSDVNVFVFDVAAYCTIYFASLEPFSFYVENNPNSYATKDASSYTYNGITYYYTSFTCPSDNWIISNAAPSSVFKPEFISGVLTGEISYSDPSIVADEGLDISGLLTIDTSVLDEVYKEWSRNKVNKADPDDSNKIMPYWPIAPTESLTELIQKSQEDVWNGIHDYTTTVFSNWDILLNFIQAIKTGIQNVVSAVRSIPEKLAAFFSDVITAIEAIPGAFAEFWQTVIGLGQDILSNVISIPVAIAEAMLGVLIDALTWAFAISDTFVATKVEALTLKYPYLETFHALGADLKSFFAGLGSRPPVIYINLGAATGSIYWGGSQPFLDLTWYAAYKPTMDAILGGFLWLAVGWRTYLHLPGLISGATGVIGAFGSYNRAAEADAKRRRDDA